MALNFNKESVFNLKPIELSQIREDVKALFISGEEALAAFQTIRDQLVFTNKRIIAIDVQGITGKRKEFTTMPYSKIQFFSIQTPGFLELFPDSELSIHFSDGTSARFEIKGNFDIGKIGRIISEFIL